VVRAAASPLPLGFLIVYGGVTRLTRSILPASPTFPSHAEFVSGAKDPQSQTELARNNRELQSAEEPDSGVEKRKSKLIVVAE